MSATETSHVGGYEYTTALERLLLPASEQGKVATRVRYRAEGARVYRSFLLLVDDDGDPSAEQVLAAIEEHAANGR